MKFTLLFLLLATSTPLAAQSRAESIAAEFTKTKDRVKTKKGVTTRKFVEVVSEPWRVSSVRDYAGHYRSASDDIVITTDGSINAYGNYDGKAFDVRNAKIVDGVLTGMKTYSGGRTEPLEAAFLKRSTRNRPGEPFNVSQGIGILMDAPPNSGFTGPMHLFLEKRR